MANNRPTAHYCVDGLQTFGNLENRQRLFHLRDAFLPLHEFGQQAVGQRPHGAAPASGPKEDTPSRDVDSVSGGGAAGVDGE